MTRVLATGDLVLERADSAPLLAPALGALAEGDILIGQLEVPHTEATVAMSADVPALPAPPSALDGVAAAGFDVLTLAGNHVFDFGGEGIAEYLETMYTLTPDPFRHTDSTTTAQGAAR